MSSLLIHFASFPASIKIPYCVLALLSTSLFFQKVILKYKKCGRVLCFGMYGWRFQLIFISRATKYVCSSKGNKFPNVEQWHLLTFHSNKFPIWASGQKRGIRPVLETIILPRTLLFVSIASYVFYVTVKLKLTISKMFCSITFFLC